MVKEILVYVLLGFGVVVAITCVFLYLRMYKQLSREHKQAKEDGVTASLSNDTFDNK